MPAERGFGKTMVCGTCCFWCRDCENQAVGECRYAPPVVLLDADMTSGMATVWPDTTAIDWCGRWLPNESASPFGRVDPVVEHAVEDVRICRGPSEVES